MINRIEEIENIINESDEIVVLYVKIIPCDADSGVELEIQKNIDKIQRDIKLYSLCYRQHETPVSISSDDRVYIFIPKNQTPVLNINTRAFIKNFDSVMENVTSILKKMPPPTDIEVRTNLIKADNTKKMLEEEDITIFPSTFQMARNIFKQAWNSTEGVLQGRSFLAEAKLANERLNTCNGCEFLKEKRCGKCGCFMEAKTQLEAATCPIGKW